MNLMVAQLLNYVAGVLYIFSGLAAFKFESLEWGFGLLLVAQGVEFFHRLMDE